MDALAEQHPQLTVRYRYDELSDGELLSDANASEGLADAEFIESLLPGKDADYYFVDPGLYGEHLSGPVTVGHTCLAGSL